MRKRTLNRQEVSDCRARKRVDTSDLGWRLPSGQSLAEFALRSGMVAPRLLLAGGTRNEPLEALLRRCVKD